MHFKICIEGDLPVGATVTGSFSVTVNPAATPLTVTPSSATLPDETVGVADAGDTVAVISGGVPPYTVGNPQNLPPGMNLAVEPDGVTIVIEGTPTTAGSFSGSYSVTDSSGASANAQLRKQVS
jgi:large repetitive protein